MTALLLRAEHLPLAVVQWTVVTSSLVDGLFIAGLASLSGGLDSILFWLFVALIVRNALSVPPGFSQLLLNVAISLCYVSGRRAGHFSGQQHRHHLVDRVGHGRLTIGASRLCCG